MRHGDALRPGGRIGRAAGLLLTLCLAGESRAAGVSFAAPIVAGQLMAPPKRETSGLAASRRNPPLLWTHDDSGGAAALYGVRPTGEHTVTLKLRGVKNEDWEDVAAFERDGKPWLVVADVGDNDAKRPVVALHFLPEPALSEFGREGTHTVAPAQTLRVRYEDGPRDCEGIAVDATGGALYLLTKRDTPTRLYRVDLPRSDGDSVGVARFITAVANVPQPTSEQRRDKSYLGRRRGEVTAMAFAPDGSGAVVVTYGGVLWYARTQGEAWPSIFGRPPWLMPEHPLVQTEAACFSIDGKAVYLAAEGDRRLLRFDRR